MKTEFLHQLPPEWATVSELFVALGDSQRQRILLTFEPDERLNVSQIVSTSKLSRTTVSHHLKVLRQAGALKSEKIAKEVYFWIDKEFILQALQGVMDYVQEQN